MSIRIHLVLLVLFVTSRVTIGNDEVLRKSKSDEQPTRVTADANSVVSSTEMQGATPRIQKTNSNPPHRKAERLSSTSSHPKDATKESSSNHSIDTKKQGLGSSNKNETQNNKDADIPSTTTHKSTRHGTGAQDRDSKLMSLLAARRSALQRDRWRSHRRIPTTNRTTIETTSKSPSDSRSTCERNCTKNFTRRTTASCMRRCVSMQRVANSSANSFIRTKVEEKDNNEILFTDESSHGIYVVTKELNDTANHISDGTKSSSTSTEKNHKIKSKLRSSHSHSGEEMDMKPYIFFGQKLPPLKPTVLKITKVSDEHPKVLEVSVPKSTDRNRFRGRFNQRERNIVAYNRRHGISNFSRSTITTSTEKSFGLLIDGSEEKLIKEADLEDHSTITVLIRSPKTESTKVDMSTESTKIVEVIESTDKWSQNFTPVTIILEEQSTPLIISVPEVEERSTRHNRPVVVKGSNMVQSTLPIPVIATESTITSSTEFTINPNVFMNSTLKSTLTSPMEDTNWTFNPIVSTTAVAPSEYRDITTKAIMYQENITKTTISSSIRSTVNPPSNLQSSSSEHSGTLLNDSIADTTQQVETEESTEIDILEVNITKSSSVTKANISDTNQNRNETLTEEDTPEIEGVVLTKNEATVEVSRVNTATYVMAGLGMLPVIVIIFYVGKTIISRRRFKDEDDPDNCVNDEQPISPVRKMDHIEEDRNDQYSVISNQEFDRNNLRFKSLLGEGNFGQVWKAEADDLSGHLGTTRIVAVKTVRAGSGQCGLKEEAEIMRKLGSHPNVVTLLGACIETEPHLLIMEYAMRGRLLSLLRAARSATNILPASVPGGRSLAPLSPRTLTGFALDIARGMEYIADKKIVHRDLAARNVLLDHNGVCKICDFGMSIDLEAIKKTQTQSRKADILRNCHGLENRFRFDIGGRLINHWNTNNNHNNNNNINTNNNNNSILHEKKHHDSISKRPALPIRWMAPEALQYHIFSTETDVWAFGIVLWEIATLGCTPYPNLTGREVVRCVPQGARPEMPKDGRLDFYELMSRCWHKDPRQRPTFREARIQISRNICKWVEDDTATSDYMDVSGFSEDLEHGMVYFNRRISEFECEI